MGMHSPNVQILTTNVFWHYNLASEVRCTGDAASKTPVAARTPTYKACD